MVDANSGDPSGRRLAAHKAGRLADAGAAAQALHALLQRAGVDTAACVQLLAELKAEEQAFLGRAYGRLESRRRFKGHSAHALLEGRPISYLFVDECGKSFPEVPTSPQFFALGGIAMPAEKVPAYCFAADVIKADFFGTTDITFHEPNMRRRTGVFYFGGDKGRQEEFDRALDQLVAGADFTTFGVGVRKAAFTKEFVETGIDPYLPTDAYAVAVMMLLERYLDFMADSAEQRMGRVTFESIGSKEDADHQLEYARLLLDGSQWVSDSTFRNWLETGLRFTPKSGSDPMELADMFSRDLFEWIRGDCTGEPKRWRAFSRKVYCRADGLRGKFGVKVFPDSDIRERVLAHRAAYGATLDAKTPPAGDGV